MATRQKAVRKKGKGPQAFSPQPMVSSAPAPGQKKGVARALIVVVLIVCAYEGYNLFSGKSSGVSMFQSTPKEFKVQDLLHIGGENKKYGHFRAWGATPIGKDKIAVSDQQNNRILVFDAKGNYVRQWGKKGNKAMEFQEPSGMTWDDKGNAYVIDCWNSAIKGFDENGHEVVDLELKKFQSFFGPRGIAWDGKHFFIADSGSNRVVLISPQGDIASVWGHTGDGKGEMKGPGAVATDGKGNYMVADSGNKRVQIMNADGAVQKIIKYDNMPAAVTASQDGRFFVALTQGNDSVKAYDSNGKYLGDLRDQSGNGDAFRGLSWMSVSNKGVLMITDGATVSLYQLPALNP